jgi:PAS domain S-box-containing protein
METETKAKVKAEEGLNKLLDVSVDSIVWMDDRDRIIHWNPAAERMLLHQAEALRMTVSELMPRSTVRRTGTVSRGS